MVIKLIWFIVLRQTKHGSNARYYFPDPTNVGCFFFSLSLSLPPQILPISTSRRTSWSSTRQTQIGYNFRLWVIIKALLKQISLYLLSHSRIRIIVLTCPDNINVMLQVCKKSSAEIMRACKITQITMMRGQCYFNWNLRSLSVCSCSCEDSRVPPLNLYWDISIAEDLYCLKAVDRNFVRNGGNNTDAFVALQLGRCIRTNR